MLGGFDHHVYSFLNDFKLTLRSTEDEGIRRSEMKFKVHSNLCCFGSFFLNNETRARSRLDFIQNLNLLQAQNGTKVHLVTRIPSFYENLLKVHNSKFLHKIDQKHSRYP